MDFKTKTALCIARLYNSSACVFWLAQTPTERTQQTERWLLVQEQAGGCVFLQSTLPLSLVKHSQDTFPSQSWQLLLCHQWVPAVRTAGRCSQLEAPPWNSCCRTLWELQNSAEQWETLQGCELSPGECELTADTPPALQQDLVISGALACSPRGEGHRPGKDNSRVLHSHTEDAPRILQDRTLQVLLQKQSTKGITQTCAHVIKGKLHPLCSAWMEF